MTDEEIKEYWRTAYCNEKHKKEELADKVNELQAQIKKMKNCRNCKNEKIEGACGHFTQVGWCRDWELAD